MTIMALTGVDPAALSKTVAIYTLSKARKQIRSLYSAIVLYNRMGHKATPVHIQAKLGLENVLMMVR